MYLVFPPTVPCKFAVFPAPPDLPAKLQERQSSGSQHSTSGDYMAVSRPVCTPGTVTRVIYGAGT